MGGLAFSIKQWEWLHPGGGEGFHYWGLGFIREGGFIQGDGFSSLVWGHRPNSAVYSRSPCSRLTAVLGLKMNAMLSFKQKKLSFGQAKSSKFWLQLPMRWLVLKKKSCQRLLSNAPPQTPMHFGCSTGKGKSRLLISYFSFSPVCWAGEYATPEPL